MSLTEGGASYKSYFAPAMELVVALAQENGAKLCSGETVPAASSGRRQSCMDGDAFRLCELEVVNLHLRFFFILGIHMYSDGSRFSWSSGTLFVLGVRVEPIQADSAGETRGEVGREDGQNGRGMPEVRCVQNLTSCLRFWDVIGHLYFLVLFSFYVAPKMYPVRVR